MHRVYVTGKVIVPYNMNCSEYRQQTQCLELLIFPAYIKNRTKVYFVRSISYVRT